MPWRLLDRATLRAVALVCLAYVFVGASFGALAVAGGLAVWIPIAMSILVFAGGSQFAAVGIVLSGGSPIAGVVAGLALNARLLAFGLAVGDSISDRPLRRWFGAHLIVDESVAFVLLERDRQRRRAVFWVCGVAMFLAWNVGVAAGALAGQGVGDVGALGLDAAFPAVLLALVLPSLADRGVRRAALAGVSLALASAAWLPVGLPVLFSLAGLVLIGRKARPSPANIEAS